MLKLMLITNNRVHAAAACACGVDRIFVDLETLGKRERQGHKDTLISHHTVRDVVAMRAVVPEGRLVVRTNPLHPGSLLEIDAAIEAGAAFLMLPMFTTAADVSSYCDMVCGRVPVIPLIETLGAVECVDDLVKIRNVSELYVGLNDLHLELGVGFIFEVLLLNIVDRVAAAARRAGLPFGFGGVARMNEGLVPGRLILAEHQRVGSSSVILSRTFMRTVTGCSYPDATEREFRIAIEELRQQEGLLSGRTPGEVASDHELLRSHIVAASKHGA